MVFNIKKFNKQIDSLKGMPVTDDLTGDQKARVKQRVFSAIQNEPVAYNAASTRSWLGRAVLGLRFAIPAILGLVLLSGTAYAANTSKPGDVLFPVKKASEDIQLNLAFSEQRKVDLQTQFAQERVQELEQIHEQTTAQATITKPKIQQEAETEVSNALTNLRTAQTRMEQRGDSKAAAVLDVNINRLQTHAEAIIGQQKNRGGGDNPLLQKSNLNERDPKNNHRSGDDRTVRIQFKSN